MGGFDGFPDAGERYFEDVDHLGVLVRFLRVVRGCEQQQKTPVVGRGSILFKLLCDLGQQVQQHAKPRNPLARLGVQVHIQGQACVAAKAALCVRCE